MVWLHFSVTGYLHSTMTNSKQRHNTGNGKNNSFGAVDFLWVFQFPPTSQKHANKWTGYTKITHRHE